jgi:hypothetical protein
MLNADPLIKHGEKDTSVKLITDSGRALVTFIRRGPPDVGRASIHRGTARRRGNEQSRHWAGYSFMLARSSTLLNRRRLISRKWER